MGVINKKNKPIGVFDSGIGGLSILAELRRVAPHENFVFLADQKYVPYGEKSKKELITLTSKITDFFIKKYDIKMMVVACNTATCGAIEELRAKYTIPIVGTVPAVKPAAENSKSGTIAVISTPSTSKSLALKKLIKEYGKHAKIINIGCKNLENAVEMGDLGSHEVIRLISKYLRNVINSDADYLVLGCTHYPFLKKTIQNIVGREVILIDSGRSIAKYMKYLLRTNSLQNGTKAKGKTTYLTTGNAVKFSKVAGKLLGKTVRSKTVKI